MESWGGMHWALVPKEAIHDTRSFIIVINIAKITYFFLVRTADAKEETVNRSTWTEIRFPQTWVNSLATTICCGL